MSYFGYVSPTIANYGFFCKEKREGRTPPLRSKYSYKLEAYYDLCSHIAVAITAAATNGSISIVR